MIKCNKLQKTYYGKNVKTEVLKNINLEVKEGEFVCIYGTSGCGKSTLLNILGLLDTCTGGAYKLNNKIVSELKQTEMASLRNKNIGFIFQAYQLIQELNVLENVSMPMGYAGVSKKIRTQKAKQLIRELGLEGMENKYPMHLSGGEQQRVAIARALINDPKLLLADEPTGNLDQKNTIMVMDILKELNHKGMTIVMVTHDDELAKYGNRTVHIVDGVIVE